MKLYVLNIFLIVQLKWEEDVLKNQLAIMYIFKKHVQVIYMVQNVIGIIIFAYINLILIIDLVNNLIKNNVYFLLQKVHVYGSLMKLLKLVAV
jgi:hypothetical protein